MLFHSELLRFFKADAVLAAVFFADADEEFFGPTVQEDENLVLSDDDFEMEAEEYFLGKELDVFAAAAQFSAIALNDDEFAAAVDPPPDNADRNDDPAYVTTENECRWRTDWLQFRPVDIEQNQPSVKEFENFEAGMILMGILGSC